jgi:hypothetical protein
MNQDPTEIAIFKPTTCSPLTQDWSEYLSLQHVLHERRIGAS